MADIRPFRGICFNTSRFGSDVSGLVCPPFDVISADQQTALYERDAHNVIRLELTRQAPTDPPTAKYERAAEDYRAWLRDGVLVQDAEPALYLYACRFTTGGETHERRGLIAALRLEQWERGIVRPHERVLAGPIEDRIQLMRACRANLSPIWGLYRDASGATAALWEATGKGEPALRAIDRDGAEHSVWRCLDGAAVSRFHAALSGEPIYIADGHHRYTTALQLRAELAGDGDPDAAPNFVMTHLVPAEDPGLPVTGIHRIIATGEAVDAAHLLSTLSEWFELEEHRGDASTLCARLESAGPGRPAFGLYSPRLGVKLFARLRGDVVPAAFAGDHSEAWRRLDAAAAHTLCIDQGFRGGTEGLLASGRLTYAYSVQEVEQVFETDRGDLALLLAGTPVDQVLAVADAQDRMPEKSTYFYPKPVTGAVIASLSGLVRSPQANL